MPKVYMISIFFIKNLHQVLTKYESFCISTHKEFVYRMKVNEYREIKSNSLVLLDIPLGLGFDDLLCAR